MKVLFVEARKKFDNVNIKSDIFPKNIHILYTIQYKQIAEQLKNKLQKKHNILGFEQILGCSKPKIKATPLLIGSGTFHALQLALSANKETYIYDNGRINKIDKKEINNYNSKIKGKLSKFLASENIGVIFSKKPGQNKLNQKNNILKKLKNKFKNKKFYIFISDTINLQELENFKIDFWINASCPGIELDSKKIINLEKVIQL